MPIGKPRENLGGINDNNFLISMLERHLFLFTA